MSKVARYDQGSILAPMFSLMVCIGLRGRRQKERERRRGEEGEGKRKRKRERGMRFSLPPLPRSLPFLCPHGFIRVCGRGRGGWEKGERKRERGMLFTPPSPPPLSPLFVLATKIRYVFMKRLSKPCYTSFTFSIGLSLGKLIPPYFQTPFQRNLLTSSGIRRREISREQFPTPELLVEWLQPLGAVISWIVWVIRE